MTSRRRPRVNLKDVFLTVQHRQGHRRALETQARIDAAHLREKLQADGKFRPFHTPKADDCGQGCTSLAQHKNRMRRQRWARELGEDWQVPPAIYLHKELVDTSCYIEDSVCFATFTRKGLEHDGESAPVLYVDHVDVERRNVEHGARYLVEADGVQLFADDDDAEGAVEALLAYTVLVDDNEDAEGEDG